MTKGENGLGILRLWQVLNSRNSFRIKRDVKDRLAGGKRHVVLVIIGDKVAYCLQHIRMRLTENSV
jgi:hypothetical protein